MFPPYGGLGPYGTYGNLGLYGALVAYGSEALTETSPAQEFAEVLSLEEMQSYLKIPASVIDAQRDLLILSFITAAREQAEIAQNRSLVRKQIDRYHDYWPSYRIELAPPLVSVDLVQLRDSNGGITTLAENVDYVVDKAKQPGVMAPLYNKTWPTFTPWPTSAILIRYTSGYAANSAFWSGDAGVRIKAGMRLLISWWYNNRLPFANATKLSEYPYQVSDSLGYGGLQRAR